MAAADPIPDLTGLDKTAQLDALRKRMAAIPGRRDHAPTDLPAEQVPLAAVPASTREPSMIPAVDDEPPADRDTRSPAVRARTLRTIPVPLPLAELLPHGALARGTVASVTGAGSVLVGLVAAASAAGHHVAIIGQPKFGLLAVHEQGGDLSKIALVNPGDPSTALDAASICLDGVDLVVTTLGGRDVAPTRARALLARCRSHTAVLAVTDGRMPGTDLSIQSRTVAVAGIEQGRGRLRAITIATSVHGRGTPMRTGRYTLTAPTYGPGQQMTWTPAAVDHAAGADTTRRSLAAAQ
ncbi:MULTISPECIES: hypothetical protein [Nocardiaceae]|uniref:hypothetical protein n=1 Tax=Nocardiaceae TaxID=85025 RepID=UPI00068D1BC1|nr:MULTISPECIES: hypothetical protein [Rhodococcus]OZD12086.1 hypothetical protein CH248_29230 [Rhodococcus sp. 06-156-4a]OZD15755.1 hypothetical protein CH253_22570 [Rhodococcus sp. 06-156-3C]OZD21139.1 hypothetical protein CH280_02800 [Rhodococcus sp. 06-156-4C]OZD32322.1 hypothetical protein CH284_20730 [Rhodococcus sp. 06-156-3]OZD36543.1 hypothetical protein CH247_03155 [Rhodococcus sp. 06-156-3b]